MERVWLYPNQSNTSHYFDQPGSYPRQSCALPLVCAYSNYRKHSRFTCYPSVGILTGVHPTFDGAAQTPTECAVWEKMAFCMAWKGSINGGGRL